MKRARSNGGERRQALRRYRRDRIRRGLPMALLLLSLGVAGVGAVQAYQAQRSHRATADALLFDYGAFAAWSFAERSTGLLDASLATTLDNAWNAARNGAAGEECLNTLLLSARTTAPACGCGVHLAGPESWAFHASYAGGGAASFTAGPAPEPAERDRVIAAVVAHARDTFRPGQRYALMTVEGAGGGSSRILAYSRVPSIGGDTVVYGIEVSGPLLAKVFEETMDHPDLLPSTLTRGLANGDLVAVRARGAGGGVLWESAPGATLTHPREQAVPAAMGGAVMEASVLPDAADLLIIGGLPRQRVPLLLLVFGLSGVLALMAVAQFRKEEAFALQRSDFVAGVSHELRTPLAQIRLFVETLRLGRARTAEEQEWALGTIDRETLRLARLVENVLLFSRAERGRLASLEREAADLAEEVRCVADGFRPLLRPGQATLDLDVPAGLQVEVHRDAFRQVLLNLLDNAVKYGPAGQSVRVVGRAARGEAALAVEDAGPGVPEEERGAVWEPFRRGRRTVGSVVAGSGIGLSVVREIVEAHGGRAWVEAAPGGGARFVVALPLLRTVRPARLEEAPAAPEGTAVGAA